MNDSVIAHSYTQTQVNREVSPGVFESHWVVIAELPGGDAFKGEGATADEARANADAQMAAWVAANA